MKQKVKRSLCPILPRGGWLTQGPSRDLILLCSALLLAAPCNAERLQVSGIEGDRLLQKPFSLDGLATTDDQIPELGVETSLTERFEAPSPDTALPRHVTDSAGLIVSAIESQLEKEFQLRASEDRIPLYFVTVNKPPLAAAEYAISLCEATLPPNNPVTGGVLVLESSPPRITIALTPKARLLIPDETLAALIDKAVADQAEDVSPGALLAFTGRRLADRLRSLEMERSETARLRHAVVLAGGAIAGIALFTLLVRGFFAMSMRNLFDRRYFFPEIPVSERLRAPFGGGHSATINFGRKD